MIKLFYKIVDNKAIVGSGNIIPAGFTQYTAGQEPQKMIDGLAFKTPDEINKAKWNDLNTYLSTLTVQRPKTATVPKGNKFDVSPSGLQNIAQRVYTITDSESDMWYEDWGNFTVTKVDLQEALVLHAKAKKDKITELFGTA